MTSIDDLFPPAPRVVYDVNPLQTVVAQIRFPTLLRIEAYPPVELQEAIRDRFPLVERTANPATQGLPPEIIQAIGAQIAPGFVFKTAESDISATLTPDSLTLETSSYRRWEDFWSISSHCIENFISIYQPSFVTRLGLRYQNLIRRSQLGLSEVPWSRLLSSYVAGELGIPSWESVTVDARRVIRSSDTSGDGILFQHGFAQLEGDNEQLYLVDFDFFREDRVIVNDVAGTFFRFNSRSGRAFRWAISDELHDVLGARQVQPQEH